MDKVIYTGEKTVDEVKKELNKLLNEFLREMNAKKEGANEDR